MGLVPWTKSLNDFPCIVSGSLESSTTYSGD